LQQKNIVIFENTLPLLTLFLLTQFYFFFMGRNNSKNIKAHNDKLHKAQDKAKTQKTERAEKLKAILKKFNEGNHS
jgi:hypothetical protein